MVVVAQPRDYKFLRFEKSRSKFKKYDAVLLNKASLREKRVPFGDKRYEHFKDSTGLGLYSQLDHGDRSRRKNYRARHAKTAKKKFSSSWFAFYYLW